MTTLQNVHALVTGANRGIGAAIARALAHEGARVTLLVRDAAKAATVAESLPTAHHIVEADITAPSALRRAIEQAATQMGPVDILVNNAGHAVTMPFLKSEAGVFDQMIAMHLMAIVHASQAVLPAMVARGGGHIINIASVAGLVGAPYATAYVAAKHAQVGLTRALALEFATKGVAIHAVCPGYTDTDLVSSAVERIVQKTGRPRDVGILRCHLIPREHLLDHAVVAFVRVE